jgi:hypothetical protein
METAIPTPFDIIPPPPGAWVPSGLTWGLLLVLIALAAIAALRLRRRFKAPPLQSLLELLFRDLSQALNHRPIQLERASRLARRIISQYLPQDLAGLSSTELRACASHLPVETDAKAASTAEIVRLIAELEDQAYAPNSDISGAPVAQLGKDLQEAIERHMRRFPAA